MFKNISVLEQSFFFADMIQCLITWGPIDLNWVKIHFIMLCRRYNYVLTVFNNLSPLTLRLFITYDRYSTVFPLTKSEERLENLSKQLHHVYFRKRKNDVTVRHILFKLVCFATAVPLYERWIFLSKRILIKLYKNWVTCSNQWKSTSVLRNTKIIWGCYKNSLTSCIEAILK